VGNFLKQPVTLGFQNLVFFNSETNRLDSDLVIELWNKGLLWDKLLGCHWMPLLSIQYTNKVGEGQWLSLDAEYVMNEGEVCGTHTPTGHYLLIEAHFEPPLSKTITMVICLSFSSILN